MSEKQFEECSLEDATHVEMGGVVYEIAGNLCTYNIGLRWLEQDPWNQAIEREEAGAD